MAYKILLTSLYEAEKGDPIRYFYAKNGSRYFFCDAFLTVEASTKYVLAQHEIDEIVAIGRKMTFDEGDDGRLIELREGKSFYTSDIRDLSTYSLYRYRIAQFIDELKIEQQDIMELLSPEEQARASAYIDDLYRSGVFQGKYNRIFEELARDRDLYARFVSGLREAAGDEDALPRYLAWAKAYIYGGLKDSGKLEILRENEDVKVRFIPTIMSESGELPVVNILQLVESVTGGHEDGIEIYVALNNDDMTDNYVIMNILDIIDTMNSASVRMKNVYTTSDSVNALAGEIRDDTLGYGITELAAATRTFLKYGKADMLVEYWEKHGSHNDQIEQMIYAMRRIDCGLSLCNVEEMINGINTLRELFRESVSTAGPEDYHGQLFMVLADGIRKDYGSLMEGEEVRFIDLVKWGYRKKFYQQTLTLIEARAPKEFVSRGIYYYCNDESDRERIISLLAAERAELTSRDIWQMNDVDHYFIKYYLRGEVSKRGGEDIQRIFARYKAAGIECADADRIAAHTLCDDRKIVEDALFAYYHLGDIRNSTNHAEDKQGEDTRLIVDEKDDMIRLVKINEAIEYFIMCFEKAAALAEGRENDVIRINSREIKEYARRTEATE